MKDKINIFMDWIYNKPIYGNKLSKFLYDKKFKKFEIMARKDVPDFVALCHIVNFIRLLKTTYFYHYDKDDPKQIFIMDDIIEDKDHFGFTIFKNNYIIEIKLERPEKYINIRVLDTTESKSRSELTKIRFIEHELKIENKIQELQYCYLNRLIMDSVMNLLRYYYDYHKEDIYNGCNK